MKTQTLKKSTWTWWEFEDEKPDQRDGCCDWCGVYVGNRVGSKMFKETTVSYKGLKEYGKICDDGCKQAFEADAINRLRKLDEQFPHGR